MDSIYSHRMGTKTICITDKNGTPLKNKNIKVKQVRHKFMFGCAEFSAVQYANGELKDEEKEFAQERINKMLDLFNFITLPFYWGRFEPVKGNPDTERLKKAAVWLARNGCAVKGHPLCWHTVTAPWLLNMSDEEILEAQLDRIRRDVSGFSGIIDMWDAINEVVIMPIFNKYDNGITRICKKLGRIGLVKEVFAEAKKANPGAVFLINDFNTSESYDILIEGLLSSGVPIDAIGIQSHMHQGYWGVEKTEEILDRFSRFKLPVHFTEANLVSGHLMPAHIEDLNDYVVDEWPSTAEGEERQAEEAVSFYRTLFKHPLVEAVTWWNFTDGNWLKAPAGFLTKESRVKPVYREIHNLIKGEWWTSRSLTTDENGMVKVTGFKGDYEAEFEGGEISFAIY